MNQAISPVIMQLIRAIKNTGLKPRVIKHNKTKEFSDISKFDITIMQNILRQLRSKPHTLTELKLYLQETEERRFKDRNKLKHIEESLKRRNRVKLAQKII